MSVKHLSTDEIIKYVECGVIESVPSSIVLDILLKQEETIQQLRTEVASGECDYDSGWDDAVSECISKLENMR